MCCPCIHCGKCADRMGRCEMCIRDSYNSKLGYGAPHKCMCCSVTPLEESYDADMEAIWDKFGKLVK